MILPRQPDASFCSAGLSRRSQSSTTRLFTVPQRANGNVRQEQLHYTSLDNLLKLVDYANTAPPAK
jgi:hypothetical protein